MKISRHCTNLSLVCALTCGLFLSAPSSMARQFTDAQGRTIEADIVGASETHVMLKRNGRTFKVALEKLSAQDRAHIAELREEGERRRKIAETRAAMLRKSAKTAASEDGKDNGDFSADNGANDFVLDDKDKAKADDKKGADEKKEAPAEKKPAPVGKIGKEKYEGVGKEVFECYVYKPTTLKENEKRPAMYVVGTSGHGAMDNLKKYVKGAEMNGFLLIMPVYPTGHGGKEKTVTPEEIDEFIFEKTMEELPVDKKRVFLSGFSSGADKAYRYSGDLLKKSVAGILACDAGTGLSRLEVDRGIVVYATCGAGSKRRYEMAYMFEKLLKGKEHQLRFFMGSNTWPPEAFISEGITWLNLCNLSGASVRDPQLVKERAAMITGMLKGAEAVRADDPVAAYKTVATVRDTAKDAALLKTVMAVCRELEKDEAVQKYLAGKEEVAKFVKRYFAGEDPRKRDMKKEDRSAKRAGEKLGEEYNENEWGPLLSRLGDPTL